MSIAGFLFDEHVPTSILSALLSLEPSIHISTVGLPGFTAKGTPDPELIEYAQQLGLVILTHDKSTMPAQAHDLMLAGKQHGGIVIIRNELPSAGEIAEVLLLAWVATDPAYWIDQIEYVPLSNS